MNMPPPPPPPPGPPRIYSAAPPAERVNGFAVASLVLGIVWLFWLGSLLAVIFGHIAISQMRTDETYRGKGMAIAGLVLGYVGLSIFALAIVADIVSPGTTG